ncbi:MAG: hypothetical protein QXQ94_09590 [Candidatus Bathyarchaeia archaeon]
MKTKLMLLFLVFLAVGMSFAILTLGRGLFIKECPECGGAGKVTVACDLCNGTKTISHTLAYQVLDYYEEKVNAIDGVYFKIHIKIKNTDNYGGDFSVKETVNIGGHESFQTQTVYLSSGESREIIFPTQNWYYAGFSTYSHNYAVTPSQVSVTCPKCNGIGTITETCSICKGSGYIVDTIKLWILAIFVALAVLVIGASAITLTKKRL